MILIYLVTIVIALLFLALTYFIDKKLHTNGVTAIGVFGCYVAIGLIIYRLLNQCALGMTDPDHGEYGIVIVLFWPLIILATLYSLLGRFVRWFGS